MVKTMKLDKVSSTESNIPSINFCTRITHHNVSSKTICVKWNGKISQILRYTRYHTSLKQMKLGFITTQYALRGHWYLTTWSTCLIQSNCSIAIRQDCFPQRTSSPSLASGNRHLTVWFHVLLFQPGVWWAISFTLTNTFNIYILASYTAFRFACGPRWYQCVATDSSVVIYSHMFPSTIVDAR